MHNTFDTALHIAAPDTEIDNAFAVCYDGSFDMALLEPNETVCSAGDATGACLITSPSGQLRIEIGDWIIRSSNGRLARTDYDLSTLLAVSNTQVEVPVWADRIHRVLRILSTAGASRLVKE
jgi:hypothetical protein